MKPVIGLVERADINRDNCFDYYRRAVIESGGIPIAILPPQNIIYDEARTDEIPKLSKKDLEILDREISLCDGIILCGGDRIYPYQEYIYKKVTEINMPLFGICLGMQIFAYVQDKNNLEKNNTIFSHKKDDKRYVHEVNISKYSKIFQIINKSRIMVNSSHNVHVSNINDYIVSATSFDGLIEAVEHPDKTFNIGVQWHPERMIDYDENSKKIFDYFIKCCKEEEL